MKYLSILILLAVSACSTTGPGPAVLQTKVAVPVSPVSENLPANETTKIEINGEVFGKSDSVFVSELPVASHDPEGIVKPRKTIRARVYTSAVFDSSFGVFKRLRLEYLSWPSPHFKLLELRLDSAYFFSQTLIPGNQPEIRSPPIWENYEFWICLTSVFAAGLFIGIKLK